MGRRDYEKHRLPSLFFLWGGCTHFSIVDSVAIALLNLTTHFPTRLFRLPPIPFVPLVSSPLLHSLSHDIRLAIPSHVHNLTAPLPLPHIAIT
jgi:hypothetical protein